jgi:F-type H+-transporting ATPase subunit b
MTGLELVALSQGGGQIGEVARTFGVDWPHLISQMISFGIVCAVLYALAYKPILQMLAARREQIASGLANAAQIEERLNRIEVERQEALLRTEEQCRLLIEEARTASARLREDEARRATAAGQQILSAAREAGERDVARMRADAMRNVGRLVIEATSAVTGKILTAEDHRRLAEETARQVAE